MEIPKKGKLFFCEKCNYETKNKTSMERHLETEYHKTGKNKLRCDYKGGYKCENCDFFSNQKYNYLKHHLNNHATKEERKNNFKYYCDLCDFGTLSEFSMNIHKNGFKHKYLELNVN